MSKIDRLETDVQRVMADIIENEVKDDLGFMTITDVEITNELSFMYVYYTVYGDDDEIERTKETLERAKGFIKNKVAARVKMRKVPELVFQYDKSEEKGRRIDRLIREIKD